MSSRNNLPTNLIYLALLLLVLATFALRLYRLDAVNLRGDEAFSAEHWTRTPFSPEWMALIESEPNPGSLVVYWAWTSFTGTSVFALRMLPALVNTLGLAVMMALAYRLLRDWRLALLVGVLWVGAPFLIWHAQDARQYALLTCLTPLNFYLFLRVNESQSRRWTLAYVIMQTLTVYIYYIEVFWMSVQLLVTLISYPRQNLWRMMRLWAVCGVMLIPLFVQAAVVIFVGEYEATATSAEATALLTQFVPTLLFGDNTLPLLIGGLLALLLVGGVLLSHWQHKWLIIGWMVLPLMLITIVSIRANFFLPRYVVAVTPVILVGVVMGAAMVSRRVTGRLMIAPVAVVLLLSGVFAVEVYDYHVNDTPKAPDWLSFTTYLETRTTAQDAIIVGQPDPAIEYYYQGEAALIILPFDWYDTTWQATLDDLLMRYHALFVSADPRTDEVRAYLSTTAQTIPSDAFNLAQFRPWDVTADEIRTPLDITFGDVAQLRGYTLLADSTLILYWEALAQTEGEYSVLLHIESSPDAPPVAVLDHAIANAVISTRTWQTGTLYRDPIALPTNLGQGDFTILIGFKDAGGEPIAAADYETRRLPIGTLQIDMP